jgi:hypothetical protein
MIEQIAYDDFRAEFSKCVATRVIAMNKRPNRMALVDQIAHGVHAGFAGRARYQ